MKSVRIWSVEYGFRKVSEVLRGIDWEARFKLSERMYRHMKNTINDINTVLKSESITDKEKIENIKTLISLLESVQCGEEIIYRPS